MTNMKLNKVINNEHGIYEVEMTCEEAEKLIAGVKKDYPFAVLHGTGYKSPIYILNLYADWGEFVDVVVAEDGEETTCINCGKCDGAKKPFRNTAPGIGNYHERCSTEEFWSDVVQNIDSHFIENGNAYFFTEGEGGFCGARFNIEFEDGEVLEDMGCWHRGEVPECLQHLFRRANSSYC